MGGETYIQFKPGLIDADGNIADEEHRVSCKASSISSPRWSAKFAAKYESRRVSSTHMGSLPSGAIPERQRHHVHPSGEEDHPVQAHAWRAPACNLRRAFGFGDTKEFDPFLLLDDFRNDNPDDYSAGFPWHPHRGIETITYVLAGEVEHGDSLGNRGVLGAGDVQWMTAGSGIMHQEMPQRRRAGPHARLPALGQSAASLKMTAPRYQDIKAAEIPEVIDDDGTQVRVVCGDFWGKRGPVEGVAADPRYLDISVPPGKRKTLQGRDRPACLCVCVRGLRRVRLRRRRRSAC